MNNVDVGGMLVNGGVGQLWVHLLVVHARVAWSRVVPVARISIFEQWRCPFISSGAFEASTRLHFQPFIGGTQPLSVVTEASPQFPNFCFGFHPARGIVM